MPEVINFSTRKPIPKQVSAEKGDSKNDFTNHPAYVFAKKHIEELASNGDTPPIAIVVVSLFSESKKVAETDLTERTDSYACQFWIDPSVPFLEQSLPILVSEYLDLALTEDDGENPDE